MLEARVRIELTHKGFADLSLTTWVPRPEPVTSEEWRVTSNNVRGAPSRSSLVTCHSSLPSEIFGAGDGGRTRDIDLGKVALYH